MLLLVSCKKNETKTQELIVDFESSLIPGDGNGTKNYCLGCGTSSDPSFGCDAVTTPWGTLDSWQCVNLVCANTAINTYGTLNNYSETINTADAYEVRDSILIFYTLGQVYITYANIIARVIIEENTLNSGNYLDHVSLANEIIGAKNRFLNESTDEIIMTGI